MSEFSINPAYIGIFGSIISFALPKKKIFRLFPFIIAILVLFSFVIMPVKELHFSYVIAGYKVFSDKLSSSSYIIIVAFLINFFASLIYANQRDYNHIEVSAALLLVNSAIGVLTSGDWISFFTMWEMIFISSIIILMQNREDKMFGVLRRYIYIHIVSSSLILIGMAICIYLTNSYKIAQFANIDFNVLDILLLRDKAKIGPLFVLLGMLINAGSYPFSFWMTETYSMSKDSGTVLLSSYSTKVALFSLLSIFPSNILVIYIGFITAIYGSCYSLLENHAKKNILYNQIAHNGFILFAIGIGSSSALNFAIVAIFIDIIARNVIMISSCIKSQKLSSFKMSEYKGKNNDFDFSDIISILAILISSSIPLTALYYFEIAFEKEMQNYLYNTMLLIMYVAILFSFACSFTWYACLQSKLPRRIEFKIQKEDLSILFSSVMLIYFSNFSNFLFKYLNQDMLLGNDLNHYSKLQIILITFFIFFIFKNFCSKKDKVILDFDWFFRVLIRNFLYKIYMIFCKIYDFIVHFIKIRYLLIEYETKTKYQYEYFIRNTSLTQILISFFLILSAISSLILLLS